MATKKQKYKQGEKLGTVEKIPTKHEEIAQKIIDALESNTIPWKKPWTSSFPKNLKTLKEYRGINHILLLMIPTKYPMFATFNQVKEMGGTILKGSKAIPVYFYKFGNKELLDENEEVVSSRKFFIMKKYQVFTMEQVDGIDLSRFIDPVLDFEPALKPEKLIEAYLQSQKITLEENLGKAFYSPLLDSIGMPVKTSFHSSHAYYSTMFHEMIHSTGGSQRLKRFSEYDTNHNKKEYAFEELVAEFGAAMLASYCGVDTTLEEGQSTAYIKSWLQHIKDDPTICYKAASKAQAAVDFILKETGFSVFEPSESESESEAV